MYTRHVQVRRPNAKEGKRATAARVWRLPSSKEIYGKST